MIDPVVLSLLAICIAGLSFLVSCSQLATRLCRPLGEPPLSESTSGWDPSREYKAAYGS